MASSSGFLLQGPGAPETLFGLSVAFALIAVLLALTVIGLCIYVAVQAYKRGREGWWVYLIAAFFSPFNLIAIILWFALWKDKPLMVNGKPFL